VKGIIALDYYSALIILSWMSLGVLCVLISENSWIPRANKGIFYLTYGLIAVSALAEWLGVWMDGREGLPKWPLVLVKCADYIMTPLAGGTLVRQMRLRNRWYNALTVVLVFNTAFQLVACPLGLTLTIDAQNHYAHGPFYGIYIGVYLLVLAITIIEFILYGKTFRRQNRQSLYTALVLIIAGIGTQEVMGGGYRTVYFTLTFAAGLMFIHYTEFTQLATDDFVAYQRMQLLKDPLTDILSRYAYKQALQEYDSAVSLPKDLAVYVIDINWLKEVNDTRGHDAGDELICGAARCIEGVFSGTGRCFRIGGDEFAVFANLDAAVAMEKTGEVMRATQAWTGMRVKELSVSVGCAHIAQHPGLKCQQLVVAADQKMFAAKAEYYRQSRHDRRRRET